VCKKGIVFMTGDFPIVNESLGGRDVLPGAPYAYQPETISFLSHLLTQSLAQC